MQAVLDDWTFQAGAESMGDEEKAGAGNGLTAHRVGNWRHFYLCFEWDKRTTLEHPWKSLQIHTGTSFKDPQAFVHIVSSA